MKNLKKLASLVLALVMVFSLATTAFAATVTNATTGHTYDAYQILKGTQTATGAALGQVEWGTGVNGDALLTALQADNNYFDNCNSAADVANVLAGKADDCAEAKALANVAANYLTDTKTPIPATGTVNLAAGYYLLVDTTVGDDDNDPNTAFALNSALLQVTNKGDITITKKYTTPQEGKKIVEGTSKVDSTTKSVGDTVKFELKGTLPNNYADYETYKFVFHDAMTDGLTFDGVNTVEVFLGDANGYTDAGKISTGFITTTTTTDGCDLEVSFANLKTNAAITANSVIYVTYTATLNDQAAINDANTNTVTLEFSNDPNFNGDGDNDGEPDDDKIPPTGKTPGTTVNVYTTEVTIVKKDGTTQDILPGAAFKITGTSANIVVTSGKIFVAYAADEAQVEGNKYWELTDGTFTATDPNSTPADGTTLDTSKYVNTSVVYKMVDKASLDTKAATPVDAEGFVDDNTGKLTFSGLGVGEYTITETVVPAGYNKVADITLTIGYENSKFTYTWSNDATNSSSEIVVNNFAGSTLPETGGMGTTMFYVFGGVLVLAAVVLLVTKKRMSTAE